MGFIFKLHLTEQISTILSDLFFSTGKKMTCYLFFLPISKGQLPFYSEGTIPSWPLEALTSQMSYQITLMSLSSPPELVAGGSGMAYVP